MSKLPDKNYGQILANLKERIRQARQRTILLANAELINVYWEIGKAILLQELEDGWGAKTVERFAADLKAEFTDMTGFSVRNLRYMRDFAKSYPGFPILQPPVAKLEKTRTTKTKSKILQPAVAKLNGTQDYQIVQTELTQIPWTHHTIILDKCKTKEERIFYIQKTIVNGWSKSILSIQIQSELYKRQGKAITNFENTLPVLQGDLATETLKNPYLLEFIELQEVMQERDLERALIQHLKDFMLELGRGFTFAGRQKNIIVDGDDFYLDLLFFNYILNCFVVIELKVGDFKPEYAGKLNFYVNTVNEQLKLEHHNPTIGVLLCKTPNKTVVEYSLKTINSPIGVADYEFAKALPKKFKGTIPSIKELEQEIEKEYQELKTPAQKRFEALKEKLETLNEKSIQEVATTESLNKIFDDSLIPLFTKLIQRMEVFKDMFVSSNYEWHGNPNIKELNELERDWKNEKFLMNNFQLYFIYQLYGNRKVGVEAFGSGFQLNFLYETYWYGFSISNSNNQKPIIKKLYHEQLSNEEINLIVETIFEFVINDIERHLERIENEKNK